MVKVFIDGSAGTTGLVVEERLKSRAGIELLSIPENLRKDAAAKAEVFASADLVFLCLPDAAAKEAAALVPGN
ncbi:MAG: N-acetyl-gamma-glutamyl-phosphate reductase, partial [Clostridia bacterium]|nr:N-acetyl-gamma-glutamyl-phosphate reductase [Clostridia bacterium]